MARGDDLMLTAEELRLRRLKRRRVIVILIALTVAIVAVFFGGRPTLNAIKAFQARRHADKAFAFIKQEKWQDARDEAIAAYQLWPNEPQALRAVARFLSRTRQQEALDFWKQLEDRQSLTAEDLRDEATIAFVAGETERAERTVQALLKMEHPSAVDRLLEAQLSIQQGATDDASAALDKIFADAQSNEQQQFQAALAERSLALGSGAADRVSHAWSQLEKLAQGKSEIALNALVLLAQRELGDQRSDVSSQTSDVGDLVRALENHPLAKAPHKLLALDLQMHRDPEQRDALMGRGISDWKDGDAPSLTALATWLNGKGEYQRELDTIPLEKALQSRDLFLQHVDALGALGRWDDIRQLLASERFPLDPVVQHMYLARCYAQLGQETARENNWQRALEAAGGDASKLLTLADYAEKNGNLIIAETAFSAAATHAPKLRAPLQGKLRIAQASANTKNIHDVLAQMLRIWPNDTAIQNDEAYLRLLLATSADGSWKLEDGRSVAGERRSEVRDQRSDEPPSSNSQLQSSADELGPIVELARKLVSQNPRSLPHRTLLALALLRQDRHADALAVYENIQVAANALSPSALAVHAAVLQANNKSEDAKTEVAQLPRNQLLPEERALISDL